jgi:hypothetical protein
MSTKLDKALEFANYRVTLNNQVAALREKTDSLLSISLEGGTFVINRELIAFCKALIDDGDTEAVLLDTYNNPIMIQLKPFYDEITSRYWEVTNDYHREFTQLRKARKTHQILDIEKDEQ